MTPVSVLVEIIERLGSSPDGMVIISEEELSRWPAAAITALKAQSLIARHRPATSVACPGCEQSCVMPVHIALLASGKSSPFVACDKRDDVNRVSIDERLLLLWHCTVELFAVFVAAQLGVRRSRGNTRDASYLEIGIASGKKRSQMLCLQTAPDGLLLVAGQTTLPLVDFFQFTDGSYSLNHTMIQQMVDSATTADIRYTPRTVRREARKLDTKARYESWKKAYRELRKKRPEMSDLWYAGQIAKMAIAKGRNAETIRKNMK